MNHSLMSYLHHSEPWEWTLSERQAQTLPASAVQRWVRLEAGCLWLTRRDSHGQRDDDVWLAAGESLNLPAGSEWVLQAWPQARLSLRLQAPFQATRPSSAGCGVSRRWWQPAWDWMRFSVLHA